MQPTEISWAEYTWNPVVGCSRIGPECENCWAERFARRQAKRDDAPTYLNRMPWTHENSNEVVSVLRDRLSEPDEYHYPRGPGRVFVVSMGDLFHREVSESFIRGVLSVVERNPTQQFILLTKRPDRAAEVGLDWPENAIVGTSVGSGPGGDYPDTTHRIDQLRRVDARRWVSFEPLIEPIGNVDLSGIEWIVVGGESAPESDRREMHHSWAVDLLDQARDADVRYHFKQSSGSGPAQGELLTVLEDGVPRQVEIREGPTVPESVDRARSIGGDR